MWSIHTMEYDSGIESNEWTYYTPWLNPRNMLNERSQMQKNTYGMIPFM